MKSTDELICMIKDADKNNLSFLTDKDFECRKIHYYLLDLLKAHDIPPAEFIRQMNIERSYGYQILSGKRKPSKELLVKSAILMRLNLNETQRLLKIGNRCVLYPRMKQDAIAIFAIENGMSLHEYQELAASIEEER